MKPLPGLYRTLRACWGIGRELKDAELLAVKTGHRLGCPITNYMDLDVRYCVADVPCYRRWVWESFSLGAGVTFIVKWFALFGTGMRGVGWGRVQRAGGNAILRDLARYGC